MTTENWMRFAGVEIINVARTVRLSVALGINVVRVPYSKVSWITTRAGQTDANYSDITKAPWYDAGAPESAEFAGFIPLSVSGLEDSSTETTTVEYITPGGKSSAPRNRTQPFVFDVRAIAKTERGADYGRRWLSRVLSARPDLGTGANAANLDYFRYQRADAPLMHRREVSLSRGVTTSRRRVHANASVLALGFTLTADDPYEYGEAFSKITALGASTGATGPGVTTSGTLTSTYQTCPVYDYSPLYDPSFPALVPAPAVPNYTPQGWSLTPGLAFSRAWARITDIEPSPLLIVPVIRLSATQEARMVRVAVWSAARANDAQCSPLFVAMVTYLPANLPMYIDGEAKQSYCWDGASPAVRRTDSLVYNDTADPVRWRSFNDNAGLLVTVDTFSTGDGNYQGGGTVRAALSLVSKSD